MMEEAGQKLTCSVVLQTHWDREWYLTLEQFRYRLLQVMERVVSGLEDGTIEQFVLDGQVAALEDLLEVAEEGLAERVLGYIRSGKIIIGPWYVLADEFLVSGESLLRNLELGIQLTKAMGTEPQQVGYLPDTFGHVGQMPQLLRGFGIDNAILWRGLKTETSELRWQSPDGSEVLTVFLPEGYYQPIVDQPEYEKGMAGYIDKVKGYATTSQLLLTNGGDHLMPAHVDLKARLLQLEESVGVTFVQSSYEEYLDRLRRELRMDELHVYAGEMRDNRHIYVLPNVLSARNYLKEQNGRMEDELTGYTEPLWALVYADKGKYPAKYMQQAWKSLLHNHPHDSICGCSIDEVHREMEVRTAKLGQQLEALQKGALHDLGIADASMSGLGCRHPFDDDSEFTVFNPHPYRYEGRVEGTIWLAKDHPYRAGFLLEDASGNQLPVTVVSIREGRKFESPLDAFPEFKDGVYYDIAFEAKLPGVSLQSFKLAAAGGKSELEVEVQTELLAEASSKPQTQDDSQLRTYSGLQSLVQAQPQRIVTESDAWSIGHGQLRVELQGDGTLTLHDLAAAVTYTGLAAVYSSLDAGDEYNYSPPVHDVMTYGKLAGAPQVTKAGGMQRLEYTLELNQPAGVSPCRSRAAEEKVVSTVEISLTMWDGSSTLDVRMKVDNKAKDQRLRLRMPLGRELEHTYSDSAFELVKRPVQRVEQFDAEKQKEVPVVVEPSHSMIAAEKDGAGLVIYQRGLQEYQVTSSTIEEVTEDVLELTLLRSVGWLSRDDLRTRGGGAGPNMETPDAQCVGEYDIDFAIAPANKEKTLAAHLTEARQFRLPPRIYTGRGANQQLVEITNPNVQWSAIRASQGRLELRLWNPSEGQMSFAWVNGERYARIERCGLDGRPDGGADLRLEPAIVLEAGQIQTYIITKHAEGRG
ncbi:glycoside hydrolase family 38 C-terminal domain-containing protein [Paenibacillus sp. GCM10023252]|uniref:glycoside hydrolase family 38 N-terminal domain-containing protein n=1 Tax=Paenibacillus sp. GCM10023252 TaxID=3252649 RepID=UPI0036232AB9